jgi:amino acid adenylation domain-containing protein
MKEETVAGFRLSAQQERLWAQQQKVGGSQFKSQGAVLLNGILDVAKLIKALHAVVARHEILRTVFHRQSGLKVPFQVILGRSDMTWQQVDFAHLDTEQQKQEIEAFIRRARVAERNVEEGPVVDASLLILRPQQAVLVLTVPALCGDGFGLRNLVEELVRTYAGKTTTDDPMQYADLVEWQRELHESEETRAGRTFWRNYGRDIRWESVDINALPLQSQKTAFAPAIIVSELTAAVTSTLSNLRSGASSRDALLGAFAALLWRLSGFHPVIGCGFEGRQYRELEGALGLLKTYLPIQIPIENDASFNDLLRITTKTYVELGQWQESFAWSSIRENSGFEGPELPIAFEYLNIPDPLDFGDLKGSWLAEYSCLEQFTLKLVAVERAGGGVKLEFHYDAGRLKRETVEQMAGYFQSLLTAAVERPETPVSRLPLLNEAERRQLLIEWNQTAADYPNACLHELFEAQAERTPEGAALRCGEHLLSYRELNQRANQLAHHLRAQGVGPDALVGLCVERSAEMIVALLAILKAGGAYVPLNPDNPKPRLSQQLQSVVAVITERALQSQLPDFSGHLLCLDEQPPPWTSQPSTNPALITTPENLVYVIYTSGSTGVPKGVGVRHRNLVNYTQFMQRLLQLEQHPHGLDFATVSTLAADLGNTCIYPALVSGGCLHVIPYEVGTDAQRLARYTAQYPLDVLKIVPSHLAALLDSSVARHVLPRRYLITGGEALTRALVEKVAASDSTCQLINHYGPTETTVGSLTLPVGPYASTNLTGETIPIGRPIANTQVYILDGQQQPVPVGVVGELYIAGAGVTAGYLNQTELTAERFLPNPFLNDARARMYRTGDLARYLPDGKVEFLGRSDDQVKIRGFRIELGEIEAVLSQHPAIKQAVVLARTDQRGDKRLVAYVVTRHPASADDLKHDLAQQLPDYMVPTAIVALAKFPLTANGKIDRQALPAPEQAAAKAYVAPRTPTEEQVATIWAEVLKRHRLSVDDNFFELGGHSLLATQVVSRIRRVLNTDLPLRTLFESPTVARLSEQIEKIPHAPGPAVVSIPRVSRDQELPLSFAQQRLWVLDQMDPNNPLYNIPRGLRMRGQLNHDALEKALNQIVHRHESQRTTFKLRNGEPVQVIAPSLILSLVPEDLSSLQESVRESEARRIALEEAQKPFSLPDGPLIRARLLHLAENDHVLLLTMHHIVSDAWSAAVFLNELSELYAAFVANKPSPLVDLAIQYADYAKWQRDRLQGATLQSQIGYWREQLKEVPTILNLPFDHSRPAIPRFHGAYESIPLDAELSSRLRQSGLKEDTTLFMTLLAGFYALLGRYSGQEQILIGTDVANRITPELETLMGFFINLLPLRGDLSGNPTFRELLARVRESTLGAYAHQEVPFEKLVQELQPERNPSHNPLVQVLFVMQNVPRQKRNLPGLDLSPFEVPITRSKFDLAVFIVESQEQVVGNWMYSTDLFDRSTVLRMANHYENLLRNAIARPDDRLSSLEMFSEAEIKQSNSEKDQRKRSHLQKLITSEPKRIGLSAGSTKES